MKCTVKITFSEEAKQVYDRLVEASGKSKTERMLLKSINRKVEIIILDPHYGNPIAKQLIPNEYIEKYNTNKLFRVELSAFWRMLYTLSKDEQEIFIVAFIVDILNHDNYNKKFSYRKN